MWNLFCFYFSSSPLHRKGEKSFIGLFAFCKYRMVLSVRGGKKKEKQNHLSVWSRTVKGEGHIAFPIDICPAKGMQLFTGHDIIISCSIRGAQKNETSGSLTFLHKWKKKIAIPHICCTLSPSLLEALLCPCANRGRRNFCKLASCSGRVVFVQGRLHHISRWLVQYLQMQWPVLNIELTLKIY